MSDLSINDLNHYGYEQVENTGISTAPGSFNPKSKQLVFNFCMTYFSKSKIPATRENLLHLERLIHHPLACNINNKNDLYYFIKRNWKIKDI